VKDEPVPTAWQALKAQLAQGAETPVEGVTGSDAMPTGAAMSDVSEQPDSRQQGTLELRQGMPDFQRDSLAAELQDTKHPDARTHMGRARGRWWRLGAAGVAVVLCGAGLFGSPLGEKAIAAAMQTFYVHHLQTISPNEVQDILNNLEYNRKNHQSYNLKHYGSIQVVSSEKTSLSPVSLGEAVKRSGYRIPSLPGVPQKDVTAQYMPQAQVTLRLHVGAINRLIWQLGGKTGFPANADGVPIVLTFPPQLQLYAKDDKHISETLSVMRVPSVQVPQEVNLNQVRQALTGLPFLPDDVRRSLQGPDWTHTVYVPANKDTRTVNVGGTDVVIESNHGLRTALWLAHGYAFQLSGSTKVFPTEDAMLDAVKEISG
jgi:hypothetical protein